jgi:hypothetical protein
MRFEAEEHDNAQRRDNILHATQLEMKGNEIERLTAELVELQEECGVMRRDLTQLAAAAKDYDRLSNELAQVSLPSPSILPALLSFLFLSSDNSHFIVSRSKCDTPPRQLSGRRSH